MLLKLQYGFCVRYVLFQKKPVICAVINVGLRDHTYYKVIQLSIHRELITSHFHFVSVISHMKQKIGKTAFFGLIYPAPHISYWLPMEITELNHYFLM